jgi:two-component system CheB/CheR fusion protein
MSRQRTGTTPEGYSQGIVDTVREPLIILDQDLRVVSASRSFYEVFQVNPEQTVGQRLYDLGDKQWDIPKLRDLLETILPERATFDDYEVEHEFSGIGRRTMLLNARRIPLPPEQPRFILLAIEDITSRKRRDDAFLRLAAIVNTSVDGIVGKDLQGSVVSWNKAAERIYGYTEDEMRGRNISLLAPPGYETETDEHIKRLQRGESVHDYETKRLRKDGVVIDISLTLSPITDPSGRMQGVSAIMHDITAQKKAKRELGVSEYSASIINTVREPLIVLDKDLRVVTVSRSFYDVFRVAPEETVGKLIYELGNNQWDIPRLRELLEDILPKKAAFDNYEVEHVFSAIGRRVMLLNARQIERGPDKERIILVAIEDITERKEVEAGLEKTRKELEVIKISADEVSEFAESVINTVREPLISLDQDLRVVTVSRSFYEFFKVKPEETVGQLIYDLGNKQWDIPRLRELLETILPQKTSFDNYEVEHDFATIGRRVMLLNARQIQRARGKELIILLAIEDITERRRTEHGLVKAHEELTALAAELNRTARVKSEFLANMSHELRTPLNSINGFSEVLYDETFGPLNDKQKKYVTNVLTSGRHLLALINQILDMAKLEAGKMQLSLSVLPTKSLLQEISLLVADMVGKKNLRMEIDIAPDLADIEADELKTKEIIYNLLSNAAKYTPEGGRIGMRARNAGADVEIVVWDTGVGIARENMEKIFEGFFRVDTPYSRVTEGTGLGLPLSRKLVELHGGRLTAESAGLDQGTSVRFTLPIVARKEA